MSGPITTIIFDFDGTMADSLAAVIEIYNRIASENGYKTVDESNLEPLRGKGPREVMKELGVSLYRVPAFLLRGRKEYTQALAGLKIQPGIKELLYHLKDSGYKLGLMTTNSEHNIEKFLQNNGVEIFDFMHCGSSLLGKAKALKKMITELSLKPGETVYVGDEVRDIEAARQAGVKIIAVTWGYNNRSALEQAHPNALINGTDELLKAVQE